MTAKYSIEYNGPYMYSNTPSSINLKTTYWLLFYNFNFSVIDIQHSLPLLNKITESFIQYDLVDFP